MVAVTALVAFVSIAIALIVKPGRALGVLICSSLFWPEVLRVPMGLSKMSAPRLVAMALIVRFVISGRTGKVRWQTIDLLVILSWIWILIAHFAEGAHQNTINQMIGRGFDTVLIYMAARIAIIDRKDLADMVFPVALCGVVMGTFGILEAVTQWAPYKPLLRVQNSYSSGNASAVRTEFRLGMLRAWGSTAHAIYWGMVMFMLSGFTFALRGFARHRWMAVVGAAFAFLGALSSLSSGPQVALVLLVICSLYAYAPGLIKPSLIGLAIVCVVVEVASNRHFYQLIDYLALNSGTAYYRTRLLEVAVGQLHEYWLFGVGSKPPLHWGLMIDGRGFVDVVNNFVILGLLGGVTVVALYVWAHALALRDVVVAWKFGSRGTRKWAASMAATIVALDVASMSVGLYGPPLLMSYILIATMADARYRFEPARRPQPGAARAGRGRRPARRMRVEARPR